MPLNVDTFRSLVDQTRYGNRDIVVSGEGKNATARLGNYFFDLEEVAKDVEEFVHTIEKILQLCDIWAERIRRDLYGEEAEGVSNGGTEQPAHFLGSMIRA